MANDKIYTKNLGTRTYDCFYAKMDYKTHLVTFTIEDFDLFFRRQKETILKTPTFPSGKEPEHEWVMEVIATPKEISLLEQDSFSTKLILQKCEKKVIDTDVKLTLYNYEDECITMLNQKFVFQINHQPATVKWPLSVIRKGLEKKGLLKMVLQITVTGDEIVITNVVDIPEEPNTVLPLADDFSLLFSGGQHSDVTICVDGKEIPAHINILTARSKVFAAMFKHQTTECQTRKVDIKDFGYETVHSTLRYIYTGTAPTMDCLTARELYKIADKYELEVLKVLCSNFMISSLNAENVAHVLVLASTYSDTKLRRKCIEYIRVNITSFDMEKNVTVLEQEPGLFRDILLEIVDSMKQV